MKMKKLNILKSLVDFIWYITCLPLVPLTLFFAVYMFFNDDILKVFNVLDQGIIITPWYLKILLLLIAIVLFVSIYSFYLFRSTLAYFQKRKPFDDFVINNYRKIGNLLAISGASGAIISFSFNLFIKSSLQLNFGLSSYLFAVCLGLFFMVLSETFKVAKTAKQENDLTI
ncbi:DUF2975 domain-containing protein [Lacinutrix sp. Bg11-31]|uniref:DUF2975 domain-containing protein n=1 Tax=Lacinutrix sp. Bg11-31 TaxID=2057808 RepID=UPI000C308D79|nr:DUF2975 domain-containing protein [Lacinutrix sp. Bg11-31]AUC83100.1 DUF2975 domain-containing protein [Lacinutrix sp. Bg11-31]